ncbi:MAG: [NiFe]-hydrogenase assembly chaperone HybE [Gammaproteobacteria bacterium]
MLWQDSQQIQTSLETTFNVILETRMRDMPFLNPALSVETLRFERIADDWLGILITPWSMNLLLLPTIVSKWVALAPGQQFEQNFPSGRFVFTVAHEGGLGVYAQCSLFSPMLQFQDQLAAQTAAQSALTALLNPEASPSLSRRNLLRGRFGKRE